MCVCICAIVRIMWPYVLVCATCYRALGIDCCVVLFLIASVHRQRIARFMGKDCNQEVATDKSASDIGILLLIDSQFVYVNMIAAKIMRFGRCSFYM